MRYALRSLSRRCAPLHILTLAAFLNVYAVLAPLTVSGCILPRAALDERKLSNFHHDLVQGPHPSTPQVQRLQEHLWVIGPFIVTDEQGVQQLRVAEAQKTGVSTAALVLGYKLVALNNRILMATLRNEDLSLATSEFAFIEALFEYEAQAGVQRHCGDHRNPTSCPPRVESGRCFPTMDATMQYLISLGYHETAAYAGGVSGQDFTLVVADEACGTGPFRFQAITYDQGSLWTYNTQGPEPNPEILAYAWPHWWWPSYVRWWHLRFC